MSFVSKIVEHFDDACHRTAVGEVIKKKIVEMSWMELKDQTSRVAHGLDQWGVQPQDRVVVLAPNSSRWVACDLAILFVGAICVPLYTRQSLRELAAVIQDCEPKLIIVADAVQADLMRKEGTRFQIITFEELFAMSPTTLCVREPAESDVVTIVYTSGTSGEPKGAMLTCGNIDYMLNQTIKHLEEATGRKGGSDRVFHYLPVCFAGSRIMLLTQLVRGNPIVFSSDLNNVKEEIHTCNPHYFLNVPVLLDRIRHGVDHKLSKTNGWVFRIYERTQRLSLHHGGRNLSCKDKACEFIAKIFIFPKIRRALGANLQFLICGSAPLSEETQRWFTMIGVPVLQVYGLTESTAIITMDRAKAEKPGWVGRPVQGCEIKRMDDGELVCRGPNVFCGYWRRGAATQKALDHGWLKTGDQVEMDEHGYVRILGRTKDILVPASGHNIAPEPLEERVKKECANVEHVIVIGHGRPYLIALVTGNASAEAIRAAIDRVNESLPHYGRIRDFHQCMEPLTVENGLVTANQKLRRSAIEGHFAAHIENVYERGANA